MFREKTAFQTTTQQKYRGGALFNSIPKYDPVMGYQFQVGNTVRDPTANKHNEGARLQDKVFRPLHILDGATGSFPGTVQKY